MLRGMGMAEVRQGLLTVPGVVEAPSMFKDDLAFWVNGTEVAHFESETQLDIRLTRAEIAAARARLRDDPLVRRRASGSDWVVVTVESPEGMRRAVELAEVSARAHAPAPGTDPKPPPDAARLRSLRRFHVT
jgi:hypothetical protein